MKTTLEAEWLEFRKQAMCPHAGAEQVHDMRLAFFAGAQAAKGILHAPIKNSAVALNALQDEIMKFSLELIPVPDTADEVRQ
jgi:hypothetical protein